MQQEEHSQQPELINNKKWDLIIKPRGKFVHVDLKSVWQYRNLIWMFFKRDFIAFYKQTVLGPLWYLIQPTLTALTYYMVFGRIAKLSTNGLPPLLFYMSGVIVWTYFSTSLTKNSEIFSQNVNLFGKVYFPRLVMPVSVVMSAMVAFVIQFFLLLLITFSFMLMGIKIAPPGLSYLAIPLVVIYVAVLGMGVGLIVSALTVRFRDLAYATTFVVQLWMYGTPVVYPFTQIPVKYQWIFQFNPMTAPIETMRQLMYGTPPIPSNILISNIIVTLVIIVVGLVLFTRSESNAMDTV